MKILILFLFLFSTVSFAHHGRDLIMLSYYMYDDDVNDPAMNRDFALKQLKALNWEIDAIRGLKSETISPEDPFSHKYSHLNNLGILLNELGWSFLTNDEVRDFIGGFMDIVMSEDFDNNHYCGKFKKNLLVKYELSLNWKDNPVSVSHERILKIDNSVNQGVVTLNEEKYLNPKTNSFLYDKLNKVKKRKEELGDDSIKDEHFIREWNDYFIRNDH